MHSTGLSKQQGFVLLFWGRWHAVQFATKGRGGTAGFIADTAQAHRSDLLVASDEGKFIVAAGSTGQADVAVEGD